MTGPLVALALGGIALAISAWLTHTDNTRRHQRRDHDDRPRP